MVVLNSRVLISDLRDQPRFFESAGTTTFCNTNGVTSSVDGVIEVSVDRDSRLKRSFERPFNSNSRSA
ncbi:hypothetical protein AN958_00013 [Leucoagaricus sp. SymC.cos]|nr:hypothetical protein AN958_00013 [Leucoagaricus sp. SymC.cos]